MPKKPPLISVVMPSYYHEAYLHDAVDSVLQQDWPNLELVVVDDGSKDRSLSILRRYRDPRLKLTEQQNAGAHNAINRGLDLAQGDYLAIINSDDVFSRTRLSKLYRALQNDGADFASTWIQQIDHNGKRGSVKKAWENELPFWVADLDAPAEVADSLRPTYELLRSNYISTTSNLIFSRALYENIGGMKNLRFAHDWDFALRAASRYRGTLVPEVLMYYRTHGTNTLKGNRQWMLFEVCWVLAANMPEMRDTLAELTPEQIDASHFGKLEPVFSQLSDHMAADRAAQKAPGLTLLENEALRAPFVDAIRV